ncbi:hypothetical protein HMPREF1548_03751 [Clostridium sp. KLE 1755]|nr:hypothetical protein HMPREF1548_03751 [Clostridium sp. KLE 1755]
MSYLSVNSSHLQPPFLSACFSRHLNFTGVTHRHRCFTSFPSFPILTQKAC